MATCRCSASCCIRHLPALFVLFALLLPSAANAGGKSGYDILQAVEDQSHTHANQRYDIFMLITDGDNKERTRYFTLWNKYKESETFSLIRFYKPASIKGTALLSTARQNESITHQWIYLPAFRSVNKLSYSDRNKSFMGSDFSNADIGGRNLKEDTHTLESEDEKYFYITSIPRSPEDHYGRLEYVILKNILVIKQVNVYNRDNSLLKILQNKKIKKHQNMYVVIEALMENPGKGSWTLLTVSDIDTGIKKQDNFYSARGMRQ